MTDPVSQDPPQRVSETVRDLVGSTARSVIIPLKKRPKGDGK